MSSINYQIDSQFGGKSVQGNPAQQSGKHKSTSFKVRFASVAKFLTIGTLVLTIALLLSGAGLYFLGATSAKAATLSSVSGSVYVSESAAGGEWTLANPGMKITEEQSIRTDGDGWAVLQFHEGTQMVVYSDTALTLYKVDGGLGNKLQVVVFQEAGKTSHSIVPFENKDSYYLVQSLSGVASVHGTTFSVEVGDNGDTIYSVDEGEVAVQNADEEVVLNDGEVTMAQYGEGIHDPEYRFTISGEVAAIDGEVWTIDGIEVQVSDSTMVKGEPEVGDSIRVVGKVDEEGNLVALKVKETPAGEHSAMLVGKVQEKERVQVRIQNHEMEISGEGAGSDAEGLMNQMQTGKTVRVRFQANEEGKWQLLDVEGISGDGDPEDEEAAGQMAQTEERERARIKAVCASGEIVPEAVALGEEYGESL